MSLNDPLPTFDDMMALHQKNPAALEALRDTLIRKAVSAAPPEHQPALAHTVFLMERARECAASPLDAAVAAARMMSESASSLRGAMDHLQHEVAGHAAAQVLQQCAANRCEQ